MFILITYATVVIKLPGNWIGELYVQIDEVQIIFLYLFRVRSRRLFDVTQIQVCDGRSIEKARSDGWFKIDGGTDQR